MWSSNADAVVVNPSDNQPYFVKPLERDEAFSDFLRHIRDQEFSHESGGHVKYSQAREFFSKLSKGKFFF